MTQDSPYKTTISDNDSNVSMALLLLFTLVILFQKIDPNKPSWSQKEFKRLLEDPLTRPENIFGYFHKALGDLNANYPQDTSPVLDKNDPRFDIVLSRILNGGDIKVVVFGGSNTAGGGLQDDGHDTYWAFFNIFERWWKEVIEAITGSRLTIKAIGIGGTSSGFFQFCSEVFLAGESFDLAFIELSVNDAMAVQVKDNIKAVPLEQLTRLLLNQPNHPAILYVNFFVKRKSQCFNLMRYGQHRLCDRYNITTISLRNVVCKLQNNRHAIATQKTSTLVAPKTGHLNTLAHAEAAYLIIKVISKKLNKIIGYGNDLWEESHQRRTVGLPNAIFIRTSSNMIKQPLCWTTVTPNYKEKSIQNTLNISISKTKGFVENRPVRIGMHGPKTKFRKDIRVDGYTAWKNTGKGSEISLSFTINKKQKSRSVGVIFRTLNSAGTVTSWLDDNFNDRSKITLDNGRYRQTMVRIVAKHVHPGAHIVNIRALDKGDVHVVGVVTGPSAGPF